MHLLPLPRTWNAEQPPHAEQWRNERGPLLPVHGVGVPLHPPSTLQRRPQPRQVGKAPGVLSVCPLFLAVSLALTFPSVWQLVSWPLAPTEKSLLLLSPEQPKPGYQAVRNPPCPHTPPWESIPDQLEIRYIPKRVLSYLSNST